MMLEQAEHYYGISYFVQYGIPSALGALFLLWLSLRKSWRTAKAAPSVARSMMVESVPSVPGLALSRYGASYVRPLIARIGRRRVHGRRVRIRGPRAPNGDDDGDGHTYLHELTEGAFGSRPSALGAAACGASNGRRSRGSQHPGSAVVLVLGGAT